MKKKFEYIPIESICYTFYGGAEVPLQMIYSRWIGSKAYDRLLDFAAAP